MIVLSDTSPIHYLLLVGNVDVLADLFSRVIIPPAVLGELQHPHAPEIVRHWASNPPAWLIVRTPLLIAPEIHLGRGEAEAICLAKEMQATLLLVDDRRARREAEARGLVVAGTLSVLEAAARRDLLDLPNAIAKLRQTNFHVADRLIQRVLDEDAQRRRLQSSG